MTTGKRYISPMKTVAEWDKLHEECFGKDATACPTCGSRTRPMSDTALDGTYYCDTCHERFNIKEST